MDSERTLNGYFQDFIMEPSPELNPSSKKIPSCAPTACFDCNICLDFAADPVVTLCGHLYCWPCIFRWLHLDASPRHCPVCKSSLSESSLVPLYGRGLNSKPHLRDDSGIPERPREHRNFASPAISAGHRPPLAPRQGVHVYQNPHFYGSDRVNHLGVMHSTAGALLGEIAFSLLPWAFRNHQNFYANFNHSPAMSGRNWRWRQELMAESWLHQLWLFLFCCALLCLVFF
ncbi:hypothetical protein M5K25_010242 [Dendrobium thyrsiflorum]|uniref:E3 ubiquitin-protein ligase RMA n=1 Tax=Dendrobium thyrsiflorum TaxID=117978 RepID=A0ABD0UZ55_DENTH